MLNELVAELAKLYGDPESARRVATEAGLLAAMLDFSGTSIDIWHRIVQQAENRGLLLSLLSVARREYRNNAVIEQAYGWKRWEVRPSRDGDGNGMSREPLWNEQERRSYSREMPDTATLLRFIRSVEELEQIINGSERLRLPALKDIVYNLDKNMPLIRAQVDKIDAQLDKIEERQRIRNLLMWGIAVGLLLLALTVVVMVSRQGLL